MYEYKLYYLLQRDQCDNKPLTTYCVFPAVVLMHFPIDPPVKTKQTVCYKTDDRITI